MLRPMFLFGFAIFAALVISRGTPAQGPNSAIAASVIDRVLAVHGRQWATGEIGDSMAEGRLTLFGLDGPKISFDVSILRKGNTQVQRVVKQPAGELKQGTDGTNSWEGIPGFYVPAAQGRALQFLESQTTRSMQRLFNHEKERLNLRDLGIQDKARVIEAEDQQGKRTSYFIDPDKNIISKIEFVTGEMKDPFSGATVNDTDAYVFSDYRISQGILTPFKIDRFSGRNKSEEMQFTTVRYNVGIKDADFRR